MSFFNTDQTSFGPFAKQLTLYSKKDALTAITINLYYTYVLGGVILVLYAESIYLHGLMRANHVLLILGLFYLLCSRFAYSFVSKGAWVLMLLMTVGLAIYTSIPMTNLLTAFLFVIIRATYFGYKAAAFYTSKISQEIDEAP